MPSHGLAAESGELAASDARARELAEEQKALRRVATLVAAGTDPDELFRTVSDEVAQLFRSTGAGVGRFEPDEPVMVVVGLSEGLRGIPLGTRVQLDEWLASAEVYRTGRAARRELSGDVVESPGPVSDTLRGMEYYSSVCAPIVVEGSLWGALMAVSADVSLPADTEERLEKFGELVATAIANTESRAELAASEARARALVEEQAALRRVATLVARGVSPAEIFAAVSDEVAGLFGTKMAGISRFEPEGFMTIVGLTKHHPLYSDFSLASPGARMKLTDSPSSAEVHRTGRTARTSPHQSLREEGFVETVSAPIVVEGSLWGAIGLSAEVLPADTETRIEKFGELVAVAIANAEGRGELAASEERARALAEEQAALRRVATLVARGVDSVELFSAVSDEVARLFGADGAAIVRVESNGSEVVALGLSEGLHAIPLGIRVPLDDSLATAIVVETGRAARKDLRGSPPGAAATVHGELVGKRFQSSVAAPIFVEGSLWGVIVTLALSATLPADAERRLEKFTELVATAIANAETRGELAASEARARELAEEQTALRRVATLVAQGASPDELFSAVAEEAAGVIDIPVVGVHRYEGDGTFTTLGIAGETSFTAGGRWPVEPDGLAAQILASGRPARKDEYPGMSGPLGDALRADRIVSTIGAPIVVDGSAWGFLVAGARPGKSIPTAAEDRLHRFAELVATAIAKNKEQEQRAQLTDEQAALRRVATLVARGVGLDELVVAVSNEVARLFGAEVATIGRFEPGEPPEVTAVGVSEGLHEFLIGTRTPLMEWLASTAVYRTGRTARKEVTAEDITGTTALSEAVRALGFFSTVSAPIVVEGELWGVLTVSSSHESLSADTEQRIENFSELVATAIANAESRAELATSEARAHELAREQAALRRVATLVAEGATPGRVFDAVRNEVAGIFGIPRTVLMRYDADGMGTLLATDSGWLGPIGRRWPLKTDGSSIARVRETGRAARVEYDVPLRGPIAETAAGAGVRHALAVPIVVEGAMWGVMSVATTDTEPFPVETEGRLEKFTELLATAIANAESRAELAASEGRAHDLAREQAALRRVATLVAKAAKPEEVFAAVAQEVGDVFGVQLVTVCQYEPESILVLSSSGDHPFVSGSRWPLDLPSLPARIRSTGQAARIDDFADASGLDASARDAGVKAAACAPIVVDGSVWGSINIATTANALFQPDVEERLGRFTDLVATSVSNATMRAELAASRARVVAAADDARRRIERDLHDGAQQRLVTLAIALRRAQAMLPSDDEEVKAEVSRVAEGLTGAVDELREMSRGIHPAVLTEGGLSPALKALGRRSPVRAKLDLRIDHRLPDPVEVATYYVVSEALTNASKHANARHVWISLRVEDERLYLSIRDDGAGGADPSLGSGLIGLRDRVEAVGGTMLIESPPASGTQIDVEIPVPDQSSNVSL